MERERGATLKVPDRQAARGKNRRLRRAYRVDTRQRERQLRKDL